MGDPLKEIHRKLWKTAQEEEPYREVESDDINDIIHEERGYDPRTVDKWWKILRQKEIIEEVPKLGTYKVKKPEEPIFNPEGESTSERVSIDSDLKDAAEGLGVNISSVLNEALAEEVASQREYVRGLLGKDRTELEAEYIFELLKAGLHRKETRPEVKVKVEDQRRERYKDVFDVDEVSEGDESRIERLRLEAWDVAEVLGIK